MIPLGGHSMAKMPFRPLPHPPVAFTATPEGEKETGNTASSLPVEDDPDSRPATSHDPAPAWEAGIEKGF